MPPIFVDARELAERLDVSYDTVLTWVRRGKIPARPRWARPTAVQPEHGPGNAAPEARGCPPRGRRKGWCPMTPAPRRKPAVSDPGPVRLADAIDRQPEAPAAKPGRTLPASIEPMLHIDDLAALLSCSRRLVERMRSAGKVPKPDIHVGKCPRWKPPRFELGSTGVASP